jgi:pimeloyl-ACP methyl ester carboxylesterase
VRPCEDRVHRRSLKIASAVDVVAVLDTLWPGDSKPPIVLLGHSMGGALAAHIARQNVIDSLAALMLIDVVEGWFDPLSVPPSSGPDEGAGCAQALRLKRCHTCIAF